jgi:hypothetical protein
MTDVEQPCPVCGVLLVFVTRFENTATGSVSFVWRCPNAHWWRQTEGVFTPTEAYVPPRPIIIYEDDASLT